MGVGEIVVATRTVEGWNEALKMDEQSSNGSSSFLRRLLREQVVRVNWPNAALISIIEF